jgi:sugar phosphate isomerase/epimerase
MLACHYWSIYDREVEDACWWAREHAYGGMDLGTGDLGDGARLDPAAFAHDDAVSERLRRAAEETGLGYPDLFLATPYPANDPDAEHRRESLVFMRAAANAARRAGVLILTTSPGFVGDEPWEHAFARSAATLRDWAAAVRDHGVQLSVEPHLESVADTPDRAQALVEAVPELALTLDYSHFIAGGHPQASVESLHRFAVHLHARQSRSGVLAVPVAEGVIDFRRILTLLRDGGYTGAITVEYVSSPWQGQDRVDSSVENEAMRRQLQALIDELWKEAR